MKINRWNLLINSFSLLQSPKKTLKCSINVNAACHIIASTHSRPNCNYSRMSWLMYCRQGQNGKPEMRQIHLRWEYILSSIHKRYRDHLWSHSSESRNTNVASSTDEGLVASLHDYTPAPSLLVNSDEIPHNLLGKYSIVQHTSILKKKNFLNGS